MTVGTALSSAAFAVFVLMSAGTLLFGQESLGTVFGVAGVFMSVFEVTRQRDTGTLSIIAAGGPGAPFHFPAERGLVGGLFGGVIAGLIITVVYHHAIAEFEPWMIAHNLPIPTFWELLSPILIASSLIGSIVGLLSLGLAELFAYFSRPLTALLLNRLTGAIIGGVIAGLITGPLATLYFGLIQRPALLPGQTLAGALPAAGLLVFAITYFGRDRFTGAVWRGLLVAMIATVMVSAFAAVILSAFEGEIFALLERYIAYGVRRDLLIGGLFYGAFVGALMGLIIGLTLALAPSPRSTVDLRTH